MELFDFAEQIFIGRIAAFAEQEFEDIHGINPRTIPNLMCIQYLIDKKGSCYTSDIYAMYPDYSRKLGINIAYAFNGSVRNNLIIAEKVAKKEWKYELTVKGKHFIMQYMSWVKEKEKDYYYQVRLNRVKLNESQEK